MAASFDARFGDTRGELRVRYLRGQFVVGRDDQLIRLLAQYGRFNYPGMPTPQDITINQIVRLGLFTKTHMIDCSDDSPLNYCFQVHSQETHVLRGNSFEGRRIREAEWPALRDYGAYEFARAKCAAAPDFSFVDYSLDGIQVAYRRLILPLSRDGREVSHLLVAFSHDKVPVAPRPLEQMRA